MSNAPLQPDPEAGAPPQPVAPIAERDAVASEILAVADAKTAEVIPLSIVDEFYRRPGKTLLHRLFGFDPLDVWFGRFYVGTFGAISALGIALGTLFYLYTAIAIEGTYNILAARIDTPPVSDGFVVQSGTPGFLWLIIMISATIAFVGWLLRQVDISLKLDMSLEVPIAFGAVVSSWLTLQWLRPIAMGAWGHGFPLGITHHLDWVSNIGYQYFNFFYNPFHAIGISLLFASTLFLAMHGSTIMSGIQRPGVGERHIDVYWRGIVGYSIGEIGIHRLAFWTGAASVLFANVCIFLSGPVVKDWNGFWAFWDKMPIWSGLNTTALITLGIGATAIGIMVRPRGRLDVDLDDLEHGGRGIEGNLGRPYNIGWINRLFGNGQVGPIHLGYWGIISVVAGSVTTFIILIEYLYQVGYNPIVFAREFPNLSLDPPNREFGLGIAPWHEGGAWLFATFFLHISVLTWWVRIYTRARITGLGTQLAQGFAAALALYFVIYLIRPVLLGNWTQAPGHGIRALLDWTNYVSIQSGNFYYNPFHMLSIFFLLGSTLLLAMHGATIVATSPYKSELEMKETEIEGPGTHRAQLFWRWVMGFNANAASIHYWAWWFAALCGITGAIGLLLSLTVIPDWFAWGEAARIVSPWPNADWAQFTFPLSR